MGNHEFFDLRSDPAEEKNISGSGIQEEKNLQKKLFTWKKTFQSSQMRGRDIEMDDKVRKDLGEDGIDIALNDTIFIAIEEISKKVLSDIEGCSLEDIEECFTDESVFNKKSSIFKKLS